MISVAALILRLRREASIARAVHEQTPTDISLWIASQRADSRLAGAMDCLRALEHDIQVEIAASTQVSAVDQAGAKEIKAA